MLVSELRALWTAVGLVYILNPGTLANALGQQQVNQVPIFIKGPETEPNELPEICSTLKTNRSGVPQESPSPYEIIVERIAPSVYEVIIQGTRGQLFTDFILAVSYPYQGEFAKGSYETFKCDMMNPDKETLIRTHDRFIPKRQAVAHFYPRRPTERVILRGSVYFNQTTFWSLEHNMLQFPMTAII